MIRRGVTYGNACARSACDSITGAWWWNKSTRLWYCRDCAMGINRWAPGLCVFADDSATAERLTESR